MPARAYVFDAYGTLLDVHAAIGKHRERVGADAAAFSELWRIKQIEYTWTHSLLGHYVPFWTLTERALDFCFAKFPHVDRALKPALLAAYRQLGAYADARPALMTLRGKGVKTAILSNGSTDMLQSAVEAAQFTDVLDFVLSVDAVRGFKPGRAVYQLAVDKLGVAASDIAFVSSNRWDVAGAANFGFGPIWVNRAGNPDEYPEFPPVKVVKSLSEVESAGI
jgi:2-haloacid dehalogenase